MNVIHILHFFTLAFVVLKLTDVIAWSWWLVLLPSYFVLALTLIVALFMLVFAGIAHLLRTKEQRQKRRVVRALENYADAFRKHD